MKTTIKVGAIVMNKEKQVLLIKEKYTEADGFKWNFIKGTYDRANESLVECAKRELQEEVGLNIKIENLQLREIINYGKLNDPKMLFIFYVLNIEGMHQIAPLIDQKLRGENIASSKWFSLEESRKLKKEDFVAEYVYLALKNLETNLEDKTLEVKYSKC